MTKESDTVDELHSLLIKLVKHLEENYSGKDVSSLTKSINILQNRDTQAYWKIHQHVTNALRPIYDNRKDTEEFNRIANSIYQLIDKDTVFRRSE